MGINNKFIDTLFETAIRKDRDELPLLPEQPDSSMLSPIKAGNSGLKLETSIVKDVTTNVLFKPLIGLFCVMLIGIASYIIYTYSQHTPAPLVPLVRAPLDSIQKAHADTFKSGANDKKLHEEITSSIKNRNRTTGLSLMDSLETRGPVLRHATDLLPPESSRTIDNGSLEIPIKRKN